MPKTKEEARSRHAAWKRKYRKKSKFIDSKRAQLRFKRELKSKPCADCGCLYPSVAMEFDHLFGKKFKISQNGYRRLGLIQEEAQKCDVVCVLCHRLRSFNRAKLLRKNSVTAIRKRTIADRVDKLKEVPCALCEKTFHSSQMDFDHIDPSTKIDKICNLVRKRKAWSKIADEIAKCRVLCALCHRLNHGTSPQ